MQQLWKDCLFWNCFSFRMKIYSVFKPRMTVKAGCRRWNLESQILRETWLWVRRTIKIQEGIYIKKDLSMRRHVKWMLILRIASNLWSFKWQTTRIFIFTLLFLLVIYTPAWSALCAWAPCPPRCLCASPSCWPPSVLSHSSGTARTKHKPAIVLARVRSMIGQVPRIMRVCY